MEIRERIKLILKEINPWWKDKDFKVKGYSPRQILTTLKKFFSSRQIIALAGLRRVGKTTLILKIIEFFLKKIKPYCILYFSFDDFSYLDIEDLLVSYREIFPEINLREDKFLFCFDEIQKLESWQEKLKRIYDIYPNIKIIVSGSETLFLRKKIKETLAGRIFEFKISPLNFKEYIYFTKNDILIERVELYKEELKKLYREFLKNNGFPELAGIKEDMFIHKYLKEAVIDKILFKDIPYLFKIKNQDLLAEILDIIIFSPGQIIDILKLSKELKITRQSVSLYLDYLEKSFLIKKIYNFSPNLRKEKRKLKKYYPIIVFPSLIEKAFSFCFENSLIWQLGIEFFYRDVYKNEVDAIMASKDKIIPVEIKCGKINLKSLYYFMKKYKIKKSIVISWDEEKEIEGVKVIPFYKLLLKEKIGIKSVKYV